jgi:4-hydroxy-tetrahydrodipicolinate reductase
MEHLAVAADLGVGVVIGTTGFSDEQRRRSPSLPKRLPSFWPQ